MLQIDVLSRIPIYEQIASQFERMALVGVLPPGSQLPSVRSLSLELSINPNTIQKAYAELDRRGISISVPGRGSFIREDIDESRRQRQLAQEEKLRELLREMRQYQISRDRILACINEVYAEDPAMSVKGIQEKGKE
jgi:GntR family transcriptional regulator